MKKGKTTRWIIIGLFLLSIVISSISVQSIVPVRVHGNHANIICVPSQYTTIQEAIISASDGDKIIVSPGTYYGYNINFYGKSIKVISSNGPEVTTIDGMQQGSVVTFEFGEGPFSVLSGFTITNGTGCYDPINLRFKGGGIYIHDASPTIINNIIK